jgi:hypothetical protein
VKKGATAKGKRGDGDKRAGAAPLLESERGGAAAGGPPAAEPAREWQPTRSLL